MNEGRRFALPRSHLKSNDNLFLEIILEVDFKRIWPIPKHKDILKPSTIICF